MGRLRPRNLMNFRPTSICSFSENPSIFSVGAVPNRDDDEHHAVVVDDEVDHHLEGGERGGQHEDPDQREGQSVEAD